MAHQQFNALSISIKHNKKIAHLIGVHNVQTLMWSKPCKELQITPKRNTHRPSLANTAGKVKVGSRPPPSDRNPPTLGNTYTESPTPGERGLGLYLVLPVVRLPCVPDRFLVSLCCSEFTQPFFTAGCLTHSFFTGFAPDCLCYVRFDWLVRYVCGSQECVDQWAVKSREALEGWIGVLIDTKGGW